MVLGPMLAEAPALCGWLNGRGVAAAVVRSARAAAAVEAEAAAAAVVEAAEAAAVRGAERRTTEGATGPAAEAEAEAEAAALLGAAAGVEGAAAAAAAAGAAAGAAAEGSAEGAAAGATGAAAGEKAVELGGYPADLEWGLSWGEATEARRRGEVEQGRRRLVLGVIAAHLANLVNLADGGAAGGAAGGGAVALDEASALEAAQACLLARHAEALGIGWLLRGEAPPEEERSSARHSDTSADDVAARQADPAECAATARQLMHALVSGWSAGLAEQMECSPDTAGWLLAQRPSALRGLLLAQQRESVRLLDAAVVGAGLTATEREAWHTLSAEERDRVRDRHRVRATDSAAPCPKPNPSLKPNPIPTRARSALSSRMLSCIAVAFRPTPGRRGPRSACAPAPTRWRRCGPKP